MTAVARSTRYQQRHHANRKTGFETHERLPRSARLHSHYEASRALLSRTSDCTLHAQSPGLDPHYKRGLREHYSPTFSCPKIAPCLGDQSAALAAREMTPFQRIFVGRSVDRAHGAVSSAAGTTPPHTPVPDEDYLTLLLQALRIRYSRRGRKRFYGVAASWASVSYRGGNGLAEFTAVTTPGELRSVTARNLDRVVQANVPLMGPVPYRGGAVEVEVGLLSMEDAEIATAFIYTLADVAGAVGVAHVELARLFVEPVCHGIDLLTGAANGVRIETGWKGTLNPPTTGCYAVVDEDKSRIDISGLRADHDGRLVHPDGTPVDASYLVLRVEATPRRDDFYSIPTLARAYDHVTAAVQLGNLKMAQQAVDGFTVAAQTSPDLIPKDATRLADLARTQVQQVLKPTLTAGSTAVATLPPLSELPLYS